MYSYGLIILYIAYLAKKNGEKSAFLNNFSNSITLLSAISINLIIITIFNFQDTDFVIFPYDLFTVLFIVCFLPTFSYLMVKEKRKLKAKALQDKRNTSDSPKELPLKYDIYRKSTHLVVLAIVLFYFSIFYFEGNIMLFNQNLVVFLVGISLIGLMTADFVRILYPERYPLKPVNTILREKELHLRVGSYISMAVACFSVILLFGNFYPLGPLCICTSIAMAIFGDISSNLIGRTIGRKLIRESKKTYEGLFAGIISAFVAGILMLSVLRAYYLTSPLGFLLLPLIGSLIIGILDYADLEIDDNLTYIFVVTTVLFFISFYIA